MAKGNHPLFPGWMMFSEFCRKYKIPTSGHSSRLLKLVRNNHKKNLTPGSSNATWAVDESQCKLVFNDYIEKYNEQD